MPMDTEKKKEKKFRYRGRVLVYTLFIAALVLSLFDFYLETRGFPDSAKKFLENLALQHGLNMKCGNMRGGIVSGLIMEDVVFRETAIPETPVFFKASRMQASLSFSFSKPFLYLSWFEVKDGVLSIPLFPEDGLEGINDVFVVEDIQAAFSREEKTLKIEYLSGSVEGNSISAKGAVHGFFSSKERSGSKSEGVKHEISPVNQVSHLPREFRKQFVRKFHAFNKREYSSSPRWNADIHIHQGEPSENSIALLADIPSFTFRHLKILSLKGRLEYEHDSVSIREFRARLENGSFLEINGSYLPETDILKGGIRGKIFSSQIAKLMPGKEYETNRINAPGPITLEADLHELSIKDRSFRGKIRLKTPELKVKSETVEELECIILLDQPSRLHTETLRISKLTLESKRHRVEFSGVVNPREMTLKGNVSGELSPNGFHGILPEKVRHVLKESIVFSDRNVKLLGNIVEGGIHTPFRGRFHLMVPALFLKGSEIRDVSGILQVKKDKIYGSEFQAVFNRNLNIKASFEINPPDSDMILSIAAEGRPQALLSFAGKKSGEFLDRLLSDTDFPDDPEKTQINMNIYRRWKEDEFTRIRGNAAISDFTYRGNKFEYGAGSFVVQGKSLVLVPKLILKRPEGHAFFSLAYDARKTLETACPVASEHRPDPETRVLRAKFKSTLDGDVLTKTMMSRWNVPFLKMPEPVPVEGSALIDYLRKEKVLFNGKIDNGACIWKNILFRKVNGNVIYENRRIDIDITDADLYGGQAKMDYSYSYPENKGRIKFETADSGFQALLADIGIENKKDASGRLSADFDSGFRYDKDKKLMMDGAGNVAVENADIWEIPFLKGFIDLLPFKLEKDWGSITVANAQFTFEGDRIKSDSIQTNGKVLALTGKGEYRLDSGIYDFLVRASFLRESPALNLMSRIFDPVTWMLQARLRGQGNKMKWEGKIKKKKP